MNYDLPYGDAFVNLDLPEKQVLFIGEGNTIPAITNMKTALLHSLENPIGTLPLRELVKGKMKVLILVEDITRHTPLAVMLPIIVDYLNAHGVQDECIQFLTAPGTHRIMTGSEMSYKYGNEIMKRFNVMQHDAANTADLKDIGVVTAANYQIPIQINRHVLQSDFLMGIGSIVPHADVGYSGGAKIVQPGVCGFTTTSATHITSGLCKDIPLGMKHGNQCRMGMEKVAEKVGLSFIINAVENNKGEVAGIFSGHFVKAHREGVELSEKSFKVPIPKRADIVIVSSSPADIDYWQGGKGAICAYFAVKQNGIVIFAAPCYEGLVAGYHPKLREWLSTPLDNILHALRTCDPKDTEADIVSAVVAVTNCRVVNRASVFVISEGLTEQDCQALHYTRFASVQSALDKALHMKPNATIGIIPKGATALPMVCN